MHTLRGAWGVAARVGVREGAAQIATQIGELALVRELQALHHHHLEDSDTTLEVADTLLPLAAAGAHLRVVLVVKFVVFRVGLYVSCMFH